ncbi:hypothetical protein ACP4OV_019222 [Aristida adscensionis]
MDPTATGGVPHVPGGVPGGGGGTSAAPAVARGVQAEKAVAEFRERAVKALDVCNAVWDGVDRVRRWERLAGIAASMPQPASEEIHEGKLRCMQKALSDGVASHRNRSFGHARALPRSVVAPRALRGQCKAAATADGAARMYHGRCPPP